MQIKLNIRRFLIAALFLGFMSGMTALQAQSNMPARDPLAILKNALQDAGAPTLTSAQESSIKDLLSAFRSAQQPPPQNTAVQTARAAYETAILNGNSSAAASQASAIAKAQLTDMVQRESEAAVLAINVINVLKTGSGQAPALITKLGESGFVRLVLNLAGGRGGFGPRPGGPGPAGMGPGGPPRF
jgi:hypothetical protein